tara:strand:- start:130 stop:414 length:285 start_codon:yes stop_codon:yes gene_type:complete
MFILSSAKKALSGLTCILLIAHRLEHIESDVAETKQGLKEMREKSDRRDEKAEERYDRLFLKVSTEVGTVHNRMDELQNTLMNTLLSRRGAGGD